MKIFNYFIFFLQNLDYIIVSGARRQENRWDPTKNGQVVPEDKETSKKLFDDAMFKLEHTNKDISNSKEQSSALNKLLMRNENVWQDDFAANQALRRSFREDRKKQKIEEAKKKNLLLKSSLSIELLPEHPDDVKMASLLALAPAKSKIGVLNFIKIHSIQIGLKLIYFVCFRCFRKNERNQT